jgi:hypothetical protein
MIWLLVLVLGSYAVITLAWAAFTSFFVTSQVSGTFILLPPLAFVLISLFLGGIDAVTGIVFLPVRLVGLMLGDML